MPLAALDRAKLSVPFPREEDSLSVDFTGRVIDNRYRIQRKIGEGGMGSVYAGEHIEIDKDVAVKILHPIYSGQQDLVERFRREARAASRIGHPNIIDVTDYGTTEEGCAYFVMEHLDGIDLADVLSHERRLDLMRACQITMQVCRALTAAHAAGVIHRDLKPENVFLVARDGKADFVKVLDFGIARSMGRPRRLTNPGVAMGTPEYMAPEQATGGAIDQRSDIYSVGALLYEMVVGTPPQQRGGVVPGPKQLRQELPDELDRIVLRALAPDPEQRYQTMRQLEYDLVKALWGRPRAVAELLGLRVMRRRGERAPSNDAAPLADALMEAQALGDPRPGFATGADPARAGAVPPRRPTGTPCRPRWRGAIARGHGRERPPRAAAAARGAAGDGGGAAVRGDGRRAGSGRRRRDGGVSPVLAPAGRARPGGGGDRARRGPADGRRAAGGAGPHGRSGGRAAAGRRLWFCPGLRAHRAAGADERGRRGRRRERAGDAGGGGAGEDRRRRGGGRRSRGRDRPLQDGGGDRTARRGDGAAGARVAPAGRGGAGGPAACRGGALGARGGRGVGR